MTIIFVRFPLKTYFHALFIEYLGSEWRDQTHLKALRQKISYGHTSKSINQPSMFEK